MIENDINISSQLFDDQEIKIEENKNIWQIEILEIETHSPWLSDSSHE